MMTDAEYMKRALGLASLAARSGDIPVGALVVDNKTGEIIGEGYNTREKGGGACAHAEISAIEEACRKRGGWRLSGCTLYVTLEPCTMCAGACVNSRIDRVVFALKDAKSGAFGSVLNLNFFPLNHKVDIVSGVCERESADLLRAFFEARRIQ